MTARKIVPGLYSIPLGRVNVYYLDFPDGGTLIDTGFPNSANKIFAALKDLGKTPADIRNILITHAHPDHIGSLAEIQERTDAETYVHSIDSPIVTAGTGYPDLDPTPGWLNGLLFQLFMRGPKSIDPARVDHDMFDGQTLPIAGGLTVIHAPGHRAGQVAFHWPRHGGVLFAADACMNMLGLNLSLGHEDLTIAERSLRHLSEFDFKVVCFGHGKPILNDAAARFRKKWPAGFAGKVHAAWAP